MLVEAMNTGKMDSVDEGDAQESFQPSLCTQQLVSPILSSHGVSSHTNGWLRPTQQTLKQLLNLGKGQCGTWTESHLEHGGVAGSSQTLKEI